MKFKHLFTNPVTGAMAVLYVIASFWSSYHLIDSFKMFENTWGTYFLAGMYELAATVVLAALVSINKMNRATLISAFVILTGSQVLGNMYHVYSNIHDFQSWIEMVGLVDEELITQKRILSGVFGAALPIIVLLFVFSMVDYLKAYKPEDETLPTPLPDLPLGANIPTIDLGDDHFMTDINDQAIPPLVARTDYRKVGEDLVQVKSPELPIGKLLYFDPNKVEDETPVAPPVTFNPIGIDVVTELEKALNEELEKVEEEMEADSISEEAEIKTGVESWNLRPIPEEIQLPETVEPTPEPEPQAVVEQPKSQSTMRTYKATVDNDRNFSVDVPIKPSND